MDTENNRLQDLLVNKNILLNSLKKQLKEAQNFTYLEKRKAGNLVNLVRRMKLDLQHTASVASEFQKVHVAVMVSKYKCLLD